MLSFRLKRSCDVFTFVIKIWKSWWRVWITFEIINWLFNDGYRSVWGDRVMFSRIVCDVVIKIRRSWEFESFLKRFVDYLTMIKRSRDVWRSWWGKFEMSPYSMIVTCYDFVWSNNCSKFMILWLEFKELGLDWFEASS